MKGEESSHAAFKLFFKWKGKFKIGVWSNKSALVISMDLLKQGNIYTERDGRACAAVNQLWAWLFTTWGKYFPMGPRANSTIG